MQQPNADGFGMHGSGLFIINPPWTLPKVLQENMPALTETLAMDSQANFNLNFQLT